jgi:hypothetical protein
MLPPTRALQPIEIPLAECRPTLGRFLSTFLPAERNRRLFADVRAFLLFIGYPRSGHTLVGSLLNAHRNMLVGHELNVLHYVKRHFTRAQIYWMLHQQDQAFSAIGRQWTTYDYQVPNQWQGRHERLEIVGDKHGNGATSLLAERPDVLAKLRRTVGVPVKMLHIVRHPLDNIATMSRKYQCTLDEAARTYLALCETNARLCSDRQNEVLTVHLEDVVRQPQRELLKMLAFLNLPADIGYLTDCASIVFSEPRQSRHSVEWPDETLRHLAAEAKKYWFLDGYSFARSAALDRDSIFPTPTSDLLKRRAA